MSPQDEYFDWVSARKECSLHYKFEELKIQAKNNAEKAGFKFGSNGDFFVLSRDGYESDPARSVTFNLELVKDRVLVSSNPASFASFEITLTLDDDGECRYRINGQGKYKCWQVLHRTLEGIFFDPLPPEASS